MSTAPAVQVLQTPARVVATIVGDDLVMRRRASDLLSRAGFDLVHAADAAEVPDPCGLIILLSRSVDSVRVHEVRALTEKFQDARVLVVMPSGARSALLRRALVAGASGILLEADVERALAVSARAVMLDQLPVPSSLARQIAPRPLSHREKQIIALVVRGLTNREIADKLFLAESTVKTHLSSAFRKLDARSRSEAVARIQDPETGYGMAILAPGDEPDERVA